MFLFFIGTLTVAAQQEDILKIEADTLLKKVKNRKVDQGITFDVIRTYLKKAQQTQRNELIGRAYFMLAIKSSLIKDRLHFIDSTIHFTKDLKNDLEFPFNAYIYKGFTLINEKNFRSALDYFLLAEISAKQNNNRNAEYNVRYNIAMMKRFLELHDESEALFLECKEFEESQEQVNQRILLKIIFQLSSLYYESAQVAKATEINKQGIKLAKEMKDEMMYNSFVVNEGINLHIKGDYKTSIDSLQKGYDGLLDDDKEIADFYLGKSYYELGNKEKGIYYFKKIDSILNKTNDLYPSLIPAYEYLINDSKSRNDKEAQLYYTNQLLRADTIMDENYKYILNTIVKKHDVPGYLAERDAIILELEKKNRFTRMLMIISVLISFIAVTGLLYYYRLKKVYKKRYDKLMQKSSATIKEDIVVKNAKPQAVSLGIDPTIVEDILVELGKFEKGEAYLINQISLKDVAKVVNTNSKYLSKIVNTYKEKNFTAYINDLRIDYLVNHVQTDTKYQKYTIRAIAEEIGFSNPEGFSRAFQKKTGLKPSYFIKKVRENTGKKQ